MESTSARIRRFLSRPRPGTALASLAKALAGAALMLLFAAPPCPAEQHPIQPDGVYDDWLDVAPLWTDPGGDGGGSGIDFGRIWIADDDRFLFLRFESGTEIDLDEDNTLYLYFDTDADAGTGLSVGGIGAELAWRFGQRQGSFYLGGQVYPVAHPQIRFHGFPTVTAAEFEIAFGRDATPDGSHPLFPGQEIRVLFRDFSTSGDWAPNQGELLTYSFDEGGIPSESPLPLEPEQDGDLRLVTWNVQNDSPWDPAREGGFRREIQAVQPQVLCLQEIYDHTITQTRELVESWLPSEPGEAWYGAAEFDCHVVSRFPINGFYPIDGNVAVYLNTTSSLGTPLLLFNAHLPCCTNDAGRQAEIDRILSFVRDAMEPGGPFTIPEGTPIVIAGDLNLVGDRQQLVSLLTGDIVDNNQFGPDFDPDWDGSHLRDVISRQTELRMAYTWRNDNSTYWPGRLDFVIYTDSVLDRGRHCALYTPEMSAEERAAYGLGEDDSRSSDHLLHVVDLRPTGAASSPEPLRAGGLGVEVAPNPVADRLELSWSVPAAGPISLSLIAPTGRLVARVADGPASAGRHHISWTVDGRIPAGVYFLRLETAEGRATRRIVLLR